MMQSQQEAAGSSQQVNLAEDEQQISRPVGTILISR
jgi:hypothetical protein